MNKNVLWNDQSREMEVMFLFLFSNALATFSRNSEEQKKTASSQSENAWIKNCMWLILPAIQITSNISEYCILIEIK